MEWRPHPHEVPFALLRCLKSVPGDCRRRGLRYVAMWMKSGLSRICAVARDYVAPDIRRTRNSCVQIR